MNLHRFCWIHIFLSLLTGVACEKVSHPKPAPMEVRVDLAPPGKIPVAFAPGVVSTADHEYSIAVSTDFEEIFFTRHINDYSHIYMLKKQKEKNYLLTMAPFSGNYADYDQAFSPDQSMLIFASDRPKAGTPFVGDIWFVTREGDGWSEARGAGHQVNTPGNEACPSLSEGGTLYFHAVYDRGMGGSDIYAADCVDGKYGKPRCLGPKVSTEEDESNAFIAPDESYILFGSNREDSLGAGDLYVCFKNDEGKWTDAINLGAPINTASFEYCPSVSPDGKFLFFTRIVEGDKRHGDIFWVDAALLHGLYPGE